MNSNAVTATIESLRGIFAIVLALALGEAYKQFIGDVADRPAEKSIRWDSLPAMISFLFLLVPFYHGMARYLYEVYASRSRPQPYAAFLLLDVGAFTVEGDAFLCNVTCTAPRTMAPILQSRRRDVGRR